MKIMFGGGLFGREALCYQGREILKQLAKYHTVEIDAPPQEEGYWKGFYGNFKRGEEDVYVMNGHITLIPTIAKNHKNIIHITQFESKFPQNWVDCLNHPNVKQIWAISKFTKKLILDSGVDKPIEVIYLGLDKRFFKNDINIFKDKSFKFFNICAPHCVGIKDRKGLDILLPAFKEEFGDSKDVTLILKINTIYKDIYHKNKDIYEYLKNLIPDSKLNNIVVIIDYYSNEGLNNLYNSIDCGVFPSRCLSKDTKLITKNGTKPIEEIIPEEDFVFTHKGNFKRVIKKIMNYNNYMYKIKVSGNNQEIKITGNHKVPCIINGKRYREIKNKKYYYNCPANTKQTKENSNIVWKKISQLKEKDYLIFPRNKRISEEETIFIPDIINQQELNKIREHPGCNKINDIIILDKDMARFFGLYIAEGCNNEGLIFCFNTKEKEYIKFVCKIIKNRFGLKYKINHLSRNRTIIRCYSKILSLLFGKLFGIGARNKKIPLFLQNHEYTIDLLQGLFEGDGYLTDKCYDLSTTSEELANNVFQSLINRCRIIGNLAKMRNRLEYCVSLKNMHLYKFKKLIGKKAIMPKYPQSLNFITDDYAALRIIKKEKIPYNDISYDLEVDEDHTYTTTSFTVHNSEGFGLPQAELIKIGKPVLATNYSATNEFTDPDLRINIKGMETLDIDIEGHPYEDMLFAEPSKTHLKKLMREVYENKDLKVNTDSIQQFDWDKIGLKLNKLLK